MEGGKSKGIVTMCSVSSCCSTLHKGSYPISFTIEGLDPKMYESLAKIGLYTTDLILYEPEY